MKLYYYPGACSLADHIALHQAQLSFEIDKVDLKEKRTEGGADYTTINPKGYVPALTLDSGETLTENIAILDWISHQSSALAPVGSMGHIHLLEMLAFISTEIHKSFKPFFSGGSDEEKANAADAIGKRLGFLAETLNSNFLLGAEVSVADCYLFVMLLWAKKNNLDVPPKLAAFYARMMDQPAVQTAMTREGLL